MSEESVRKNLRDYLLAENAVQAMLSIDLGNSRTAMALIDHVNESDFLPSGVHCDVPLNWERRVGSDRELKGPYASRISMVVPHDSATSFVRIGEHAVHNERVFRVKSVIGTHSLSSPKRYFADNRIPRTDWKAAEYGAQDAAGSVASGSVADFSGEFPIALASRYGAPDAKRLPRAAMLGGMVAELYEQAHRHANSEAFKLATNDERPRFISHIHLTYPTTFTEDEKCRYRLQVDKAMRVFFTQKKGLADAPFAEILCGIDEASAVLAHYAQTALADSGGNAHAWLSSIGRRCMGGNGYEARVAVIDIGGGTSDLAIANLTQTVGNPNGVDVQLLFLDGVNKAGDDFLAEIAKSWFLPRFVKLLKPQIATADEFAKFRDDYNRWIPKYREFIRTICAWVFDVFNAIENGVGAVTIRIEPEDRRPLSELFAFDDSHEWAPNDRIPNGYSLKIEKEDVLKFQEDARRFFLPVVDRMAREIAALDCDLLILSGKMCELRTIRDLVENLIAVPPFSIVAASDLVKPESGGDVKFATVLGGAQLALQQLGAATARSSISFSIGYALTGNYEWGFTADGLNANPRISNALGNRLAPDEQTGWLSVSIGNLNLYILRQCAGNLGTVTVSHVLCRAQLHRTIAPGSMAQMKVHEDGRLKLMAVHGCASDGTQLTPDDFVLTPHGYSDTVHWLDDGRI
jgi:hypothetical protein